MKVHVKLFATLVRSVPQALLAHHPQGIRSGIPIEVELAGGSTLADLLVYLRLPPEEVKLIFVNGRAQEEGYHLSDGDQVGIFPPVGGG